MEDAQHQTIDIHFFNLVILTEESELIFIC
jgi:hypothetical protein